VLKIDDQMSTMDWLKKFKNKLDTDKLEYKDNEYESSGFDPLNIVTSEGVQDKKKDINLRDKEQQKASFKNIDLKCLEVCL
jgi:hypothetical protein